MNNCNDLDKRTKAYKDCIKNQSEGLGDTIEKVARFTGIKQVVEAFTPEGKDCGCDKRKERLNNLFPIRRKPVRCFTEEQYNEYKSFINTRTLNIWNNKDIDMLIRLYAHIFAVQYHNRDLCRNCNGSAKILFRITEELDKVFDSYKTE